MLNHPTQVMNPMLMQVMLMNLKFWIPPIHYRVENGQPARYDIHGSGRHRLTGKEDVPLLRAHALTAGCDGDGHYECRRCIFWRSRE